TIPLGAGPEAVAATESRVWVEVEHGNPSTAAVVAIDPRTNTTSAPIRLAGANLYFTRLVATDHDLWIRGAICAISAELRSTAGGSWPDSVRASRLRIV